MWLAQATAGDNGTTIAWLCQVNEVNRQRTLDDLVLICLWRETVAGRRVSKQHLVVPTTTTIRSYRSLQCAANWGLKYNHNRDMQPSL